jgi:hypothetical protein
MSPNQSHDATPICESVHSSSYIPFRFRSTYFPVFQTISPSNPTAGKPQFRCPLHHSYLSTMTNQQRVRFIIPGDSKPKSLDAYVSLTDLNSSAPACPTSTEQTSQDEDAENEGSASNSDPPASLLESAPLYVPTAEEDETFGWWGPPSPQETPAAEEQAAPEPPKRRKSWLPTLRQVVNLFAGRRRDATGSRPRSLSAPAAGTAGQSVAPNRQEDLPCPTDPIWIPGQEPSWRDAWDSDHWWGGLYPAASHPTTGYAWVEPDVFEPEVVQRGFHVPSEEPDSPVSRSSTPRLPPPRS